jgi:uncharacterized protein (DUF1697 family)
MHRYIALLRGINLGYRRVTMDRLRGIFEAMKFAEVETFIASGNVIFSARTGDGTKLAKLIGGELRRSLGYEVDTFVRTRAEMAAAAAFRPFAPADLADPAVTISVGFLGAALGADQARRLVDCRTEVDQFCVNAREFYWLCRISTPESKVWSQPKMKAVALPSATMRNLKTVRKLAELYPVLA